MKIVYTALREVTHTKLGKLTCGRVFNVSDVEGKEYLKASIFVIESDWKKSHSKEKKKGR